MKPAVNKHRWRNIPKLAHTDHDEWEVDMILILLAMGAYAIITGEDPDLRLLDINHDNNYDTWKAQKTETASMIRLSCSSETRRIVKCIRNPQEMWNKLEMSPDTARSYYGR